jgi:2-amino-4-hydroxy-6-hydroxymethyldihydropteridine diphosphokinase
VHASNLIVLSLGANRSGSWGAPRATLAAAINRLCDSGIKMVAISGVFKTRAVGPPQPDFLNLVVLARPGMGPAQLLRCLKSLERAAGRRQRGRWTARPLDIDIVCFMGQRSCWPSRRAGGLTLPHPEAHRRAFVLVPLLSIAPNWHHAALRVPGRRLLERLPRADRAGVRDATEVR